MTHVSSQSLGGQFRQTVENGRLADLSAFKISKSATGASHGPVVAQVSDTASARDPNVIQINHKVPDTVVVGRTIPGVGLSGAAAGAAAYILWTGQHTLSPGDDRLTAFGSLALPARLASAAGFAPLVGFVLTQLGVAESASAADVLAGRLFSQYQRLDALLNSAAFKGVLPAGATVIPSIVATTPIQGITSVLDNGKTEIGLGLTIVLSSGAGKNTTKTAFFINSRQNLHQLLNGQNPDRSINFGGLLLNAKIPKTGQVVNIGPAWRSTLSASGSGPWELQFVDNTSVALPAPLAMVANALFDRNAPYGNAGFGELSRLLEQIPVEVREQAGTVINGGLYVADTAASISSIAAAFKAVGLSGPHGLILGSAFVLGGQFLEQYDHFVQENAKLSFQKGEFTPGLALPAGQHRGAYHGNNNIDILRATIELAIANGASVDALRTQWEDVLRGSINGGLSSTDLLQARFAAANLLGRGEAAVQLYRQLEARLGPPGVGVLVGDPAFIASAARNYAIDALGRSGQTLIEDSHRVAGAAAQSANATAAFWDAGFSPGQARLAAFVYQQFLRGGAKPAQARQWIIHGQSHDDGGIAKLIEQGMPRTPSTVDYNAFRETGLGANSAGEAIAVYNKLRASHFIDGNADVAMSAVQAWQRVLRTFMTGLYWGGNAGALQALVALGKRVLPIPSADVPGVGPIDTRNVTAHTFVQAGFKRVDARIARFVFDRWSQDGEHSAASVISWIKSAYFSTGRAQGNRAALIERGIGATPNSVSAQSFREAGVGTQASPVAHKAYLLMRQLGYGAAQSWSWTLTNYMQGLGTGGNSGALARVTDLRATAEQALATKLAALADRAVSPRVSADWHINGRVNADYFERKGFTPGDARIAGFLLSRWSGRDGHPAATAYNWIRSAYFTGPNGTGNRAALIERATPPIPGSVDNTSLRAAGMGNDAASVGNETYLALRQTGLSPEQAWRTLWTYFLQGLGTGGNAGALERLTELLGRA